MVGYWGNNTIDTLETVRNGWLDTGDTGWIDRTGDLWLMGRQKGRIKSGGENVYPEEVLIVLLVYVFSSLNPTMSNDQTFQIFAGRVGTVTTLGGS